MHREEHGRQAGARRGRRLLAEVWDRRRQSGGEVDLARRLARWWYVIRYYRTSQLTARLARVIRQALWPIWVRPWRSLAARCPPPRGASGFLAVLREKLDARQSIDAAQSAARVLDGQFLFLNEECRLPNPIDWRLSEYPSVDRLWRFHLHYQEYLLDVAAQGTVGQQCDDSAAPTVKIAADYSARAWGLVDQWIVRNRVEDRAARSDAWHPYCISRRLPVWMLLWSAAPRQGRAGERTLASMVAQVRFLRGNLEWDLCGNHLLENLKTLLLAGAFFEGREAQSWLCDGARWLACQLEEQILSHGEHFERSPMYHAQTLETLLDLADVLEEVLPGTAEVCRRKAEEMAGCLAAILHPDGEIPLLGDACLGETPSPLRLVARAGGPSDRHGADGAKVTGDYWVYRHRDAMLLFDAGPAGPDHLPAHAHADLLTVEASVGGKRLLVDGGVFGYGDDAMRRYCRSAAAHNVLEVDSRDPFDMWSRFRMGRRGWPGRLRTGCWEGFDWAGAWHNAYRDGEVPRVERYVACRPGGPWFLVDCAHGGGVHRLTSRLHFHPQAVLRRVSCGEVEVRLAEVVVRLVSLAPGEITVEEGWHCPRFGCRMACPVVVWTSRLLLPAWCGWGWFFAGHAGTAMLQGGADGPRVQWTEGQERREIRVFVEGRGS